jgi:hypothetical protein
MPCHPTPSDAPFDLDTGRTRWLYDAAGNQIPIAADIAQEIVTLGDTSRTGASA